MRFADYPDPEKYADDFLFGYLVAASGKDRERIRKEIAEKRSKEGAEAFTFKRDSVLRMNLAKALETAGAPIIGTSRMIRIELMAESMPTGACSPSSRSPNFGNT